MRQHANRIETKLIARKGQQLPGQSPTICACGMMQQLTGHTVNSIDAKQRSRQKILQFHKLPSRKRHKPSRKKITTHPPIHIMPEKSLIQRATTYQYQYAWTMD